MGHAYIVLLANRLQVYNGQNFGSGGCSGRVLLSSGLGQAISPSQDVGVVQDHRCHYRQLSQGFALLAPGLAYLAIPSPHIVPNQGFLFARLLQAALSPLNRQPANGNETNVLRKPISRDR